MSIFKYVNDFLKKNNLCCEVQTYDEEAYVLTYGNKYQRLYWITDFSISGIHPFYGHMINMWYDRQSPEIGDRIVERPFKLLRQLLHLAQDIYVKSPIDFRKIMDALYEYSSAKQGFFELVNYPHGVDVIIERTRVEIDNNIYGEIIYGDFGASGPIKKISNKYCTINIKQVFKYISTPLYR